MEVAELLRRSDLLVSASHRFETFGVAIAEAMACGIPVVATEVGAVPELVTDGSCGVLVPEASPQALAEGILTVSEAAWDSRSIANETVRFRPDVVAEELRGLYRELLSKKRRRRPRMRDGRTGPSQ